MGRILFVTWDGGGNVPPVLALADQLRLLDPTAPLPEVRSAVLCLIGDLERRAGAARMAIRIAELDAAHTAERAIEVLL